MIFDSWNKDNYVEFINYLKSYEDIKYKEFNSKLIPNINKKYIIGIRIPILRNITKQILKTDWKQFLNVCKNKYFEEKIIYGLIISNIRDEKLFKNYFSKFIKKIDNWCTCDTFCNSIKIINDNKSKYFNYFSNINVNSEYEIRCILVIFLNYYIEEEYIDRIFSYVDNIENREYYVQMAIAWLLSYCYIKFKDRTIKYILSSNLDKFTFNKTIQKIIESNRITNKEKMNLKKLKRT